MINKLSEYINELDKTIETMEFIAYQLRQANEELKQDNDINQINELLVTLNSLSNKNYKVRYVGTTANYNIIDVYNSGNIDSVIIGTLDEVIRILQRQEKELLENAK